MFVNLKPLAERKISVDAVIARLRPRMARIPGALIIMQAAQDLRVGGRMSAALYQFTMRGDNVEDLNQYAPRMYQELRAIPIIADVNSDQQDRGLRILGAVRPRHGRALRAFRRNSSTPRSTTPSASARYPPCTRR